MSVGLPSGSVQIRRIIYGGEHEPIAPVFYDDIADVNTNVLVLDTVLEYDPLIKIQGYYWNGTRNVPISNSPSLVLPQVASATLLLDLEADTLALSDGDPVSIWADQSGNGNDFTQTGDARPTKQTVSSYPAVVFDGIDDWMLGSDFADNLNNFSVFITMSALGADQTSIFISKYGLNYVGWAVDSQGHIFDFLGTSTNLAAQAAPDTDNLHILEYEAVSVTGKNISIYQDGAALNTTLTGTLAVNFSTNEPVRLGTSGDPGSQAYATMKVRSVLIYAPAPNATDRVAITAWLAARYGVSL